MSNNKLLLIDGHSILNRAFYGLPDLTNSKGIHTNAVLGFLNILFKVLQEEEPKYLAVAFDLKAPTFRHKMYKEYKGTRKAMPEELRQQVPIIKKVLQCMNINICELEGYEADDILGTLSVRGEEKGYDVTILSGDRDLLQLATKKVLIRIPKTKAGKTEIENYHEEEVLEKYLVTPKEFIDLKALMGDTADNIPGVPSIGEKTATKIITQYKSIENAFANIEEVMPNKARNMLKEHYDLADLSKKLATINVNSPIECKLETCTIDEMFNNKSFEILKELELKSLLVRFDNVQTENECEDTFAFVNDFTQASVIFSQIVEGEYIGFNILMENKEIFSLSITNKEKTYIILKEGFITHDYLKNSIIDILKKCSFSTMNLKTQLPVLENIHFQNAFDCNIAAYLLNPLKDTYYADDIARDYLNMTIKSKEEFVKKQTLLDFYESSKEEFIKYAGYLSFIPFKAKEILDKKLIEENMKELFYNVEMPLCFCLNDMEQTGIKVQENELKEYSVFLGEEIEKLQKDIYLECNEEFNINSPKQLGEVLFGKMQLKGGKKTKTGYSTSAEVLEKLKDEYPVVNKILSYRQLSKLKSTYADGLTNYILEDGRIHGKFNQTITATGRISSTEPNLQNIPIRMDLGKPIRKVFVPKDGCVFLDADYSQIELRILANMSKDDNLIEAYKEAKDIHQITAAKVFNVPLEQVTSQMRSNAKAVNFGIVYGISSFGLSNDLSISRKEAQSYIEQYFENYPSVKTFLENQVSFAKENGYVITMYNRKRPVPEISSGNFMQRSFGERIAMNSPIQGTAADIMKIAMINVSNALEENKLKSKIVLQVHDELLIEAYENEIDIIKDILKKNMQDAFDFQVSLLIDVKQGNNWLEAH